jgi:peptide deformylase
VKLEIVQAGDPVLRQRARPLSPKEIASKEIRSLIESMRECMYEAPGVGLAAPQVGLSLQLAVIEDRPDYHKDVPVEHLQERERRPVPFHVIINPTITAAGTEPVEFFEGCLSLS